ncbi:hypothetical protein LOK49_LG10G02048 [Camellia lanceoleosa]|uniref:Uncharacterized protein n=1 Tax=Camellia lanceoleosa TaxID=1840588 RepID=A0ACC0G766_9ERIC|nr:hypothetical protein LOK49_LG10G02048 [Camellia lanceoleosa]
MSNCKLMDLGCSGPRLTWSNNRKGWANTMVRLDRAMCNTECRTSFPDGAVRNLPRTYSDHSPMMVFTQEPDVAAAVSEDGSDHHRLGGPQRSHRESGGGGGGGASFSISSDEVFVGFSKRVFAVEKRSGVEVFENGTGGGSGEEESKEGESGSDAQPAVAATVGGGAFSFWVFSKWVFNVVENGGGWALLGGGFGGVGGVEAGEEESSVDAEPEVAATVAEDGSDHFGLRWCYRFGGVDILMGFSKWVFDVIMT